MIIGVKYWSDGGSAPGSWTDLHVAECEATESVYEYDSGEAMDGEAFSFKKNRYLTRLVIDPFSFNHATYGPVVIALRKAQYARIKDARYSWLGDANTIQFLVPGSDPTRTEPSILTTGVTLDLKAVVTHT